MKSKMLLAAALVVLTSVSSFAAAGKQQVPGNVITAFNADFSGAGKVTWETGTGYYKAGFIESGILCYAFYSSTGDLMGMGRQLPVDRIPVSLEKKIASAYQGFVLTELYEIGTDKTGDYLLVLQNGKDQVRLRSTDSNDLTIVKN